jgi:high affinity cGMP-specific 3',5'-cyclic phosphodiesterase 9
MREDQYNIVSGLAESKYKDFRKDAINCILATDMAKHGEIVTKFKGITETFSYDDDSHRKLVNWWRDGACRMSEYLLYCLFS